MAHLTWNETQKSSQSARSHLTGVGQVLSEHKEEIMHLWEENSRRMVPAARAMNSLALRDSIPQLLDELIASFKDAGGYSPEHEQAVAREHGWERSKEQVYDLKQVIEEYQVLRHVIFEVLRKNCHLEEPEQDLIIEAISAGIRNAIDEFLQARADVDRQHRADELKYQKFLEQSEARYRVVVEGILDHAIIRTGIQGIIQDWSKGAENIFGYTRQEVIGQPAQIIFTPEDNAAGIPQVEMHKALTVGRAEDKRWHLKKDGTRFFANGIMNPLRDEAGNLEGFIKVLRDDTERKLRQEEQKRTQADLEAANQRVKNEKIRLEQILEQLPIAVSLLQGPEFRFRYVNQLFRNIFLGHLKYTGAKVEDLVPDAKTQGFVDLLAQVYRTGVRFVGKETKLSFTAHGESKARDYYFNVIYEPLKDAFGQVEGILGAAVDVTEQVVSRARIEESEQGVQTLLEKVPHIIWKINAAGEAEFFSLEFERYTGLRVEDAGLGHQYTKVVHPDDLALTAKVLKEAKSRRGSFLFMHRLRRSDGMYRWHQARGAPVFDDSHQLRGWIGTTTDIHEQKEAEDSLRNTARELRALTELAPHIVFTNDPTGSRVWINKQWSDFTGLPMESANDHGYIDSIHPEDRERVERAWDKALATGASYQSEHRLRNQVGGYHWFQTRAFPERNSQGAIIRWIGVMSDIDALKRAEVMAKRAEQRFEVALKNAPIVVYTNDVDLRYTWIHNPHQDFRNFGSILGKRDDEILKTEGTAEVMQLKRQVLNSGKGLRKVITLDLPSGEHSYDFTVEPTFDEGGQVNGVIVAALDVSDINRAKKAAEMANEAKSTFLANMSHEIRTPMTAVLGFAEVLGDESLSAEERRDALMRIEGSGKALLRLIDDVLDISKIEAGKLEIQEAVFSRVEVVSDVVALMKLTAERKGLVLKCKFLPSVPTSACSDPARIRQILVNLIGNAIKFTENGEVIVCLSSEQDQFLVFDVCDTGIGIAEQDQQKLFQPFAQADESITRKFGGTGLGLMLSRRLAERMGGGLWLKKSEEGEGSHFIAKIRAAPFGHEALPREGAVTQGSHPQSQMRSLQGVHLLVAEDMIDNRALIELYLKNTGVDLEFAIDGGDAIRKAQSGKFDLILMDIQMPNIDGNQAVRALRKEGYRKPIVALTAHAMRDEIERSLSNGFDGHLTKPLSKKALLEAITEFHRQT